MSTGEAILRWGAVLVLLRLVSGPLCGRILGRKLSVLGVPLLLLLTGYVYWLWGTSLGLPSLSRLPVLISVTGALLLLWGIGSRVPREKPHGERSGPAADLVLLGVFCAACLLRSWMPDITGAEKFPDFAFFQGVYWDRTFPPTDRYLSGVPLNYYYFSHLVFVPLARLSGVPLEFAFNLAVATVAALSASVAFAVASSLSGKRRVGLWAASLMVLFSNWEWVRHAIAWHGIFWWDSSRAIEGTITEFPFFSFLLGDFHPHYVSLPWLGVTLAVILAFRRSLRADLSLRALWPMGALAAFVIGVHYPMNPWELPFVAAIAAVLWNAKPSRRSWIVTVGIGLLSVFLFLPFWVQYVRPISAMVWVPRELRSSLGEFAMHWGIFFCPILFVTFLIRDRFQKQRAWIALGATALVAGSAGLSAALVVAVVMALWACDEIRWDRPEDVLIAASLGVIFFCEFLSLDATYGLKLLRLNTVFKFYTMAWWALALAVPLFLWRERSSFSVAPRAFRALLCVGVLVSLVYTVVGTRSRLGGKIPEATLDGMYFWERQLPGERPVVDWLRKTSPTDVIWEGEGPAYGLSARMASFSGRSAVLGWANHEGVWRRNGWALVGPRQAAIKSLKESPSLSKLRDFVSTYGVTWIVVGQLERSTYPKPLLDLLATLPLAFSTMTTTVYSVEALIASSNLPTNSTE